MTINNPKDSNNMAIKHCTKQVKISKVESTDEFSGRDHIKQEVFSEQLNQNQSFSCYVFNSIILSGNQT